MRSTSERLGPFAVAAALAASAMTAAAAGPDGAAAEPPAERDARLAWWREARFGMFIHWGPVSLRGTEIGWSRGAEVPAAEYDALYRDFNPVLFDADEWVRIARDAGMKYLVITSKHHDGFSIWDTKLTDYNIMHSPFGRDVLEELSAACKRQGIRFCTYHSILDWWHPDYPMGSPGGRTEKPGAEMDRYVAHLKGQLRELIANYGPLGIMWFDGQWEKPWSPERGSDLYRYVRGLQPDIIINNRAGAGPLWTDAAGATVAGGDYETPEQTIGAFQNVRPWESCITICRQWAWKPDDEMKSLQECMRTLIYCAGGDGNLLFNVGPMPDGRIEPRQVERLREMGLWLKQYGQSIYGTRGGPFKPGRWGASTHRGSTIFVHLFEADGDTFLLPPIDRRIVRAALLTGGEPEVSQSAEGISVKVPQSARGAIDTLLQLDLDGPAGDIAPVRVGPVSLATERPARASNVYQDQAAHAARMAVDGDESTRWATDGGTHAAWLEIDLGAEVAVDRVVIREAYAGRVQRFALEAKAGEEWHAVLNGTTIGERLEAAFAPVVARHVRLNIAEATEGPTIWELELFGPR